MAHTNYVLSLFKLVLDIKERGYSATLYPITFESLVSRGRNAAVAEFLSNDSATHLLFIDSDIEFNSDDIFKMIDSKKEVITGCYPLKFHNLEKLRLALTINPKPEKLYELTGVLPEQPILPGIGEDRKRVVTDGISEVEYATTGFMLIHKPVFIKLMNSYPDLKYINDIDGYSGSNKEYFYDFFHTGVNKTTLKFESEDFGFCRLCRELSIPINCFENITLRHYGWYGFEANLANQRKTFSALEDAEKQKNRLDTQTVVKPTYLDAPAPPFQVI